MARAEDRKYHIVYKTTNLVNNKFYVGVHSTNNLNDGYMGSGKRILYSLAKHGKENHCFEILELCISRKQMFSREEEIINEKFLQNPLCLNIAIGGKGGWDHQSEEDLLKACSLGGKACAERLKKDPVLRERRRKDSSAIMIKAHKEGKFNYDNFSGKSHSEETKKLMSLKAKERISEKNSQFGTCWIYNLELRENKKILKDELEQFLDDSWVKGRKYFS